MCTYVETDDVSLLIDPGVSLGHRFRLLPHPEEYRKRDELRGELNKYAEASDLIIISHYHYDHYTPAFTEHALIGSTPEYAEKVYKGKIMLVKDFRSQINHSQRRRGWLANRVFSKLADRVEVADNNEYRFGGTRIFFSEPVPHGEEKSGLGWVLMTTVKDDDTSFLFASDVQGPMSSGTVDVILTINPDVLFIGGPPLYLKDFHVTAKSLTKARLNLQKLGEKIPAVVVDHHLLRDPGWMGYLNPVYKTSIKSNGQVLTMAEYAGLSNTPLEYRRAELYEDSPPPEDFIAWSKKPREHRRFEPPPLR
jgi:predicted metallo-beta-lactamase superfamily hydrolase